MKVALCHLELSNGPEQKNIELLEKAVRIAAEKGANWVITPETAVQGYYFYKLEPETKVDKQPSSKLSFLLSLVKDYGLFLFLGCGEYDSELNCLVLYLNQVEKYAADIEKLFLMVSVLSLGRELQMY